MDNPENIQRISDSAGASSSNPSPNPSMGRRGRTSAAPSRGRGPQGSQSRLIISQQVTQGPSMGSRGRPRGRTSSAGPGPSRGRGSQVSQQATQGNEEPVFNENITDSQGHPNEQIAQNLLNPNIGGNEQIAQNLPYFIVGAQITCTHCSGNIIFDTSHATELIFGSGGHYFHTECYALSRLTPHR